MFPYLQRKDDPENFVKNLTEKLDRAFGEARKLQKAAAEKNKARKPAQFKPKFWPGDFLLLMMRLEMRNEQGKEIPILRNEEANSQALSKC